VVKTLDAQGKVKGQGSGVLVPSRKIATNCHVVEGGASYQVGRGKQLFRATLYAEDGDKDVCILDAEDITGEPAQLGKASSLRVGDPVYAVGAPEGWELSLSDGIVSALRGGPAPVIQTTAAISHGSSGGGLFDGEGRLVGLTTLSWRGQSLNFAMPVEWIGEIKPGRKTVTGVIRDQGPTFQSLLTRDRTSLSASSRFSLDDRVYLVTVWTGLKNDHQFMVEWVRPDGYVQDTTRFNFTVPENTTKYRTWGWLSFKKRSWSFTESKFIGNWKARLYLDGRFLAEYYFSVI
jgi:S1-C subfamily serine protease